MRLAPLFLFLAASCVSTPKDLAELERQADAASARGDWLAAGELWHRLWVESDTRDPRHGRELARALYRQGDTAGAARVIDASLKVAPDDPDLFELLADVQVSAGRTDAALAAYESALAADPERARAWRHLGELRLRAGDPRGAIDALQQSAKLEPNEPGVYLLIAQAAEQAGDPQATLNALSHAIQQGEGTPAVLERAGMLAAERALSGAEPNLAVLAIEWLEEAVALDPQRVQSWLLLGRLAHLRLLPDRAIECLRRAVELEPTNIEALTELAAMYAETFDSESAAEIARRALELEPEPAERARLEAILAPPPPPEEDGESTGDGE